MCSKFTVEMPPPRMSRSTVSIVCTVLLVMIAPVLSIVSVVNGPTNLWDTSIPILCLSLAAIIIGMAVIHLELLLCQYQCAEENLKQAVSSLGWKPLEPISITGRKSRVLLRDSQSAALWDVSIERDKVICKKHVPSVVNQVVE